MTRDASIGSTVGGYQLVSLIARGGMGAVYLADDPRLGRQVALKIPTPELAADTEFRNRFLRETKLAASLDHQAIVPVYDGGEDDGILYLAFRYVEGPDLAALIELAGPIEPKRLVRILSPIASALDAADSHGLVHRDVKPGNILVGLGDQAYLSDFGLTKRRGSGSALTRTGQFVGTLDYVAPEMIEGKELTGAADQYSLACVAFEALTGERPFGRETDAATLYAHLHEPPPSIRQLRHELSGDVDEVVRRGMAKRPENRFPSCRAFVETLDRALAGSATKRRSRVALLMAAVGTGVALVIVGITLLSGGNDRQQAALKPSVSVDEQRLLTRVPAPIRPTCDRTQPGKLLPPASLASMTCVDDAVTVTYNLFDSARAIDDWFNQSTGIVRAPSGECAKERKAVGSYTIDLVQAGRVLCYIQDGHSHIEWTNHGMLVHASASRNDLADLDLYEWWASRSGPLDEAKDVSELDRIPEGTYTMRIDPSDREEYASTHEWPLELKWFGKWVLRLENGQYKFNGPNIEDDTDGTYVSTKRDIVIFYVDNSPYCNPAYTDSFEWEMESGTLQLDRPETSTTCVQTGDEDRSDLPPWDIHPWTRVG